MTLSCVILDACVFEEDPQKFDEARDEVDDEDKNERDLNWRPHLGGHA